MAHGLSLRFGVSSHERSGLKVHNDKKQAQCQSWNHILLTQTCLFGGTVVFKACCGSPSRFGRLLGGGGFGDVECSENSMNHRDGPGEACLSLSLIASAVELHDLTSVAIRQILKRPKMHHDKFPRNMRVKLRS